MNEQGVHSKVFIQLFFSVGCFLRSTMSYLILIMKKTFSTGAAMSQWTRCSQ